MKRGQKWALGLGIAVVALGAAWFAVSLWLPTDDSLAAKFKAQLEAAGAKVELK